MAQRGSLGPNQHTQLPWEAASQPPQAAEGQTRCWCQLCENHDTNPAVEHPGTRHFSCPSTSHPGRQSPPESGCWPGGSKAHRGPPQPAVRHADRLKPTPPSPHGTHDAPVAAWPHLEEIRVSLVTAGTGPQPLPVHLGNNGPRLPLLKHKGFQAAGGREAEGEDYVTPPDLHIPQGKGTQLSPSRQWP